MFFPQGFAFWDLPFLLGFLGCYSLLLIFWVFFPGLQWDICALELGCLTALVGAGTQCLRVLLNVNKMKQF